MSVTVRVYADKSLMVNKGVPTQTLTPNGIQQVGYPQDNGNAVLTHFERIESKYPGKYRGWNIDNVILYVYAPGGYYPLSGGYESTLLGDELLSWDDAATYANLGMNLYDSLFLHGGRSGVSSGDWQYSTAANIRSYQNGVILATDKFTANKTVSIGTANAAQAYKPYLEITLKEPFFNVTISSNGDVQSISNERFFSYKAENVSGDAAVGEKSKVTSLKLEWKNGENGEIHALDLSTDKTYIFVPAYTFTEGTIYYRATAQSDTGTTTSSAWKSFQARYAKFSVLGSPAGGFVRKDRPLTLSWSFSDPDIPNANPPKITAATVTLTGTKTSSTTYSLKGDAKSVTVPADTITGDKVLWRVDLTDDRDQHYTMPIATLTTVDSEPSVQPKKPVNTIESGNGPIELVFDYVIETGTEMTKKDIQYSQDGNSWTDVGDHEGGEGGTFTATIPANTFPDGKVYWRVRGYNLSDTPSEWASATFVCVRAPEAPFVSTNAAPFATISWQSGRQTAYRVRVPGHYDSGPLFGTIKSHTLPQALPDGSYLAEVSVLNEFGLWSEPGTAPLTVKNVPGEPIQATVSGEDDATIVWSSANRYKRVQIYRDGALIAETGDSSWRDLYVLGPAAYVVRGVLDNGNYTDSAAAALDITPACTILCDVQRGEWLRLPYSDRQINESSYTLSRSGQLTHYAGATYPSLELSEFGDRAAKFRAAVFRPEEAAALEKLLGCIVCVKDPDNGVTVGGMLSLTKTTNQFYRVYTFTIQQIHREEVAHDPAG